MEFSIKLSTVETGWFIAYVVGLHVILSKNIFLSLKLDLFQSNSTDPDENAALSSISSCSTLFVIVPISKG